jgi:fucose 4-O-acetylase-like acetyltransferase
MNSAEMNILKAIGIILVVIGHKYQIFLPIYSFHMALFFFISGFFYKPSHEQNIFHFVTSRTKSLLGVYFAYNTFFAMVTYILASQFEIHLGQLPTLENFFLEPFVSGHQYLLHNAGWFVPQLFLVQMVFIFSYIGIKKIVKNHFVHLAFFLILGWSGLYLAKNPIAMTSPLGNIGQFLYVRSSYGLCFFYVGYFFKNYCRDVDIFRSEWLFAAIISLALISHEWAKIRNYNVVNGFFEGDTFLPLVTGMLGIYLSMFFAKGIARIVKQNDCLYAIGENTFHIMSLHIFIFFLLNVLFAQIFRFDIHQLRGISGVFFAYDVEHYWPLYVTAGVLIPTLAGMMFKRTKRQLMGVD